MGTQASFYRAGQQPQPSSPEGHVVQLLLTAHVAQYLLSVFECWLLGLLPPWVLQNAQRLTGQEHQALGPTAPVMAPEMMG